MDTLPDEIFENIFQYFKPHEIKELMLVCKSWHNAIASSPNIMRKLFLCLRDFLKDGEDGELTRRYYNLKIWNFGPLTFNKTIFEQGLDTSVRYLQIDKIPVSKHDLKIISTEFVNLHTLHLISLFLSEENMIICDVAGNKREVILKRLYLESVDHEILDHLRNVQTYELEIHDSNRNKLNDVSLCGFIANQKLMTSLLMKELCSGSNVLFHQNIAEKMQFKLKKLFLKYYSIHSEFSPYITNMLAFFYGQEDSLEYLEIENNSLPQNVYKCIMTSLVNLQSLKLHIDSLPLDRAFYMALPQNHNLKSFSSDTCITIENFPKIDNLFSHYPNIEKLILQDTNDYAANDLHNCIARRLRKLEDLYVRDFKPSFMPQSRISSLKKFKIQMLYQIEPLIAFLKLHEQTIESLAVPWISRYINKAFIQELLSLNNLNHLSLGGRFSASKMIFETVLEEPRNLKKLEVIVFNLDDIIPIKFYIPITDKQKYFYYFYENHEREPFTD